MVDTTDSVTILKYKVGDKYDFHVMDKFNNEDEVLRLDDMLGYSEHLGAEHGADYKQLWIKTCPIFDISA